MMTIAVRKVLGCIALALLILTCPSMAGVVDDAEEALQGVPSDLPGARRLDGTGARIPLPPPASSTTSGSRIPPGSAAEAGSGAQIRTGNGGGSGPGAQATPDAATREALEKRQARDRADNVLSLAGVLLLLALVLAAGVYSRRVERDD